MIFDKSVILWCVGGNNQAIIVKEKHSSDSNAKQASSSVDACKDGDGLRNLSSNSAGEPISKASGNDQQIILEEKQLINSSSVEEAGTDIGNHFRYKNKFHHHVSKFTIN